MGVDPDNFNVEVVIPSSCSEHILHVSQAWEQYGLSQLVPPCLLTATLHKVYCSRVPMHIWCTCNCSWRKV